MSRRRVRASAPAAALRAPAGAGGGAAGARPDRLLGLGRALGNRAMGSLLAGGAPGREARSRTDAAGEKLDELIERALLEAGVADPGQRDRLRPRLRAAIESGDERAVEAVIDAAGLEPAVAESLRDRLAARAKKEP
jgi:hypothetical protein